MRNPVAMMTLLMLAMSVGCGTSIPTEHDVKQAVKEQIFEASQNRLILVSFQKTNGKASVTNEVPHYKMGYEGEVEVTEDCYWIETWELHTEPLRSKKVVNGVEILPTDPKYIVKEGLRRKMSGWIVFEKTEKGWRKESEDHRFLGSL